MSAGDGLALSTDERDLRSTLRGFLADHLGSADLRSTLDGDAGYDPRLHSRLVGELGLGGLTIPEEFGGLEMSQAQACVVHQELGRVLYPGPFLAGALAASALVAAGDSAAGKRWLPSLADGSVTGTMAVADRAGRWWSSGSDRVQAEQTPNGWRLHGTRWYAMSADTADLIIARAGDSIFLVPAGSPGLTVAPMPGLDLTRRTCVVNFDATPAVLIGAAVPVIERVYREFLLATAAEAAGGIEWCLDTSVAYAKEREQFGRPIGSFQAIAHSCVDMLADFQSAAAVVRYAAVASAQAAADAPLATRVAALRAGESYRRVTESAIHVLGGVGFTWEHDAHLYYRRAWSAQLLAGGAQEHRASIADLAGL